ncbi:MAG TPA: hypothetical protein PLN21_16635 [Gemmatales bacterium]|nr:hypothetical protein [Gemmatales bacterium]
MFDIPENLLNFLKLENVEQNLDLASMIVSPEKKGELISLTSLAEAEITKFLSWCSSNPTRAGGMPQIDGKTFHKKIEMAFEIIPKLDPLVVNARPHADFLHALRKLGSGLRQC